MDEHGEVEVKLEGLDDSITHELPEGPFGRPADPEDEIKEEIIESIGPNTNFDVKNEDIEIPDDSIQAEISTDEINARKAFLYFNEQELRRQGQETFDDKVERLVKELNVLKGIVKQREAIQTEESKEEPQSSILQEIESLQEQAERIVNPIDSSNQLSKAHAIKPLSEMLQKLSVAGSASAADSDNIVYELMYNKDSKNLIVAAKISELKKRINVIQKCLSSWENKKSSKYNDLSQMLMLTQDQLKFMSDKEIQLVFKKSRKLFNSIFQVQESREIQELKFETEPVSELSEIVGNDKEESDLLENDIQRLESLRNVHEESAETFNKVRSLHQNQANLINSLKDDQQSLEYVKESFAENIKVIKENLENIRNRINKIKN
jgi:hypothetical protein